MSRASAFRARHRGLPDTLNELTGCETVSEILKPRPPADTSGSRYGAQTDRAGNARKCAASSGAPKSVAALGHQEGFGPGPRTQPVALLCISGQGSPCGVHNRHKSGFSKFCLPNRQNPIVEAHVRPVERDRLPGAETGSGEKPNEGRISQCSQSGGRREARRLLHQIVDLVVDEDVRLVAPPSCR